MTDSEKFWNDRFKSALNAWREKGVLKDDETNAAEANRDLDSTANFDPGAGNANVSIYPEETPDNSMLQAATLVEEHLQSLSLCKFIRGSGSYSS